MEWHGATLANIRTVLEEQGVPSTGYDSDDDPAVLVGKRIAVSKPLCPSTIQGARTACCCQSLATHGRCSRVASAEHLLHQDVFVGIERCVCACCIGRGFVLPAPCEYALLFRREYPNEDQISQPECTFAFAGLVGCPEGSVDGMIQTRRRTTTNCDIACRVSCTLSFALQRCVPPLYAPLNSIALLCFSRVC